MSLTDDLERLSRLHAEGRLGDDEFARAKARLIADDSPGRQLGSAVNALRRSRDERWLGGVCGGLAALTGTAAWLWRLGFLLLLVCAGSGMLLYALMWLLVPLAEPALPPSARVAH